MTGTESSPHRLSVVALLLYTAFIVYQSLAHGGGWDCSGTVLAASRRLSRSDVLANVVAYVPLGLLLMLVFTRARQSAPAGGSDRDQARRSRRAHAPLAAIGSLAVIALLSGSLEVAQACQTRRVSSIVDLMANVAGGGAGVLAALAWRLATSSIGTRGPLVAATHAGRLRLLTAAVVGAWIVSQTMPWVFAVDVGTMRSNLSFLRHWPDGPPLDGWRMLRHAGAWMAIACACRLALPGPWAPAAGLVGAGALSLGLQLLLDASAPLSFEELVGMAGSAALVPAMVRGADVPRRGRWAVGLLACAVLTVAAYELRPEPGAATQTFSAWPMVGLGGRLGALDYALLFGWYGLSVVVAAQWAAVEGHPRARLGWPVAAIALMLALELAQTLIPGRGPDTSAVLFTLLAVLASTAVLRAGR